MDIGVRRMQQILHVAPFMQYSKLLKAPKLSSVHREKRLKWALNYIRKRPSYWASVIFSDEKGFCSDGPDGHTYYWADSRLDKRYFSTRPRGGGGLMIYAAVSESGKSKLAFVEQQNRRPSRICLYWKSVYFLY